MSNWMKWARIILILAAVGIGYQLFNVLILRDKARQAPLGASFEYDLDKYDGSDPSLVIAEETGSIAVPLAVPSGLALGEDDTIYVVGDRSVVVLAPRGRELRRQRLEMNPLCLDVGPDGRLYIGFMEQVRVYTTNLQYVTAWETLGEKAVLTAIAATEDSVFVADGGNAVVLRFDLNGKRMNTVGAKDPARNEPGFVVPSPYFDVAIAPDDTVWVVDPGRHELRNYTYDGKRRTSWKKASMTIEGFCGCCNPTHIAVFEDGSFVTSEKGFVRVKVYNEIGDFKGVIAGSDLFEEDTRGLDLAVDSKGRVLVLDPVQKMVRVFERTK